MSFAGAPRCSVIVIAVSPGVPVLAGTFHLNEAAPFPTGAFSESTTKAWNSRSHGPPAGVPLRHSATNRYGFGTVSTVPGVVTSRSMRTRAAIRPMLTKIESRRAS